jgi:hypothetical protein
MFEVQVVTLAGKIGSHLYELRCMFGDDMICEDAVSYNGNFLVFLLG